jgi:dibenzofuran dioxygenase beta subunit
MSDERQLHYEVEQFLFREASLLDEFRLHEWVELFTDDVRYWMPVVETVAEPLSVEEAECSMMAIYDDDKNFLKRRVSRLDTGLAHAEQPRSRTRHLLSNVRITDVQRGDELTTLTALSNFIVFQSRFESSDHFFVGRREDRLQKRAEQWKIAQRRIWLDQELLPRSVSMLF